MVYRLVLEGRLPGTNEYAAAQRKNARAGAALKREAEEWISWYIKAKLNEVKITLPVTMVYIWCEPDTRRDKDNIRQGEKFVQDALVRMGVLEGDGWKHIRASHSEYTVDAKYPRVEVYLIEQPV